MLSLSAVSFALPSVISVAENDSALLCVEMTEVSASAILDREVVVTLSAMNGTGK